MDQKIIYTDETGDTQVVTGKKQKTKSRAIPFVALAILMGAVGGIGGTIIASTNPTFQHALGVVQNNPITSPIRSDKIVVEESSAIIDASKKVSPAVVSISLKKDVTDIFGQTTTQEGGGTGFIITSDGLIVTNKHVASDTNATYTVFTADGKNYPATVVAQDPIQDLAVIKIKATGLPTIELGDSDQLQVGQYVIAIGNALGEFQNTVTLGIISAEERQIQAGDSTGAQTEDLEGLLQTDAAINEGNSGGPLVNLKGQVIGMNTATAAKSQAEGIGFAIPVNAIKNSINQVEKTGKIVRAYLGVRYVPLTKAIAETNNLSASQGAYVIGGDGQDAVVKGSPADKAGIKDKDIITAINGTQITETKSLSSILGGYNVGDTVELTIIRDNKTLKISVKLEELKQ